MAFRRPPKKQRRSQKLRRRALARRGKGGSDGARARPTRSHGQRTGARGRASNSAMSDRQTPPPRRLSENFLAGRVFGAGS